MYIKNVICLGRKATKITPTLYKKAICEENPIHLGKKSISFYWNKQTFIRRNLTYFSTTSFFCLHCRQESKTRCIYIILSCNPQKLRKRNLFSNKVCDMVILLKKNLIGLLLEDHHFHLILSQKKFCLN